MSEDAKQELKELVSFVLTLGESLEDALADKKFELAELALLMPVLMQAPTAFSGLEKLKDLELDAATVHELVEFVKADLDLDHDGVEDKVEKGLELAANAYSFFLMFKKEDEAEPAPAPAA